MGRRRRQKAAKPAQDYIEELQKTFEKSTKAFLRGREAEVDPPAPQEKSLPEAAHEALAKLARWDVHEEGRESERS